MLWQVEHLGRNETEEMGFYLKSLKDVNWSDICTKDPKSGTFPSNKSSSRSAHKGKIMTTNYWWLVETGISTWSIFINLSTQVTWTGALMPSRGPQVNLKQLTLSRLRVSCCMMSGTDGKNTALQAKLLLTGEWLTFRDQREAEST